MALQSEVSPPMVGDPNKDTKNDGDTKSDENDSSSTEEDVDLEEGEILDSGEEAEEEKKDLTNSSLKEAVDKNLLKNIEALLSQAKNETSPPPNAVPKIPSPHNSPIKINKRSKYLDHDRFENNSDQDDGWYSPSRKHKSKFDSMPIDYRKELQQYIGTPPSSPDHKHRDEKKKRRSKKSKKSGKKTIKRKDIKGERVSRYIKEANKRKMCKFFKEGKCAKGADCGFSHSSPQPFKKKELCKFYLSGHCNKGQDCLYMHNEFPCKFYHTGSECYAKDDCRFSHAPLTDETKRILNDYLKIHHGDDDYDRDRKRRRSPSPEPPKPPAKRTCLLGSPPRHIREAEETKRWQEEMLHNQMNHPGFKIHISPGENESPPPFQKPNFYQETMPSTPSPQRHRINPDVPVPGSNNYIPPTSGFGMTDIDERIRPSPSDIFVYEEDYQDLDEREPPDYVKQEPPDFSWNEMPAVDHNLPPIKTEMEAFVDAAQQDLDFTSDVKFDETTQFSEMESSTDCSPTSPRNSAPPSAVKQESDEENSNEEIDSKTEDFKTRQDQDDSSSAQESVAAPIVIPSHLPKKQQELFKRIQQHQLKHAVTSDASSSPKALDASEVSVKEEPEIVNDNPETEKAESLWYSSEEDDDDDTEPLTDVLKKLQKEPPPKVEPKAATNLLDMLNKITQNNKGTSDLQQGAFLKNLIGTISTPVDTLQIPGLNLATSDTVKRTVLLPDPQPAPIVKEPVIAPKDPRLKNRDPRLASTSNTAPSLPIVKTIVMEQNILKVGSSSPNHEFSTSFTNTTIVKEPIKEDVPYKLHGIYTRPPNYASYISASQNNPSLLKDPRLRKHMNLAQNKVNGVENSKDIDTMKTLPVKNAPPIPKLLLKYDKSDSLSINIFESTSSAKSTIESSQDLKPQLPKLLDPRMRRRESQNSSGSNTPPHLTIVETSLPPVNNLRTAPILEKEIKPIEEKKWLPPVLEKKSWTLPVLETTWTPPPIKQEVDSDEDNPMRLQIDENSDNSLDKACDTTAILKKAKPIPASHLPRAIADPRMAKLHDSRRTRISTSESSNKSTSELKKVNQNSEKSSRLSPVDTAAGESENSKTIKSIPKKSQTIKNEEKKKPIHRNRKSSMDYASPLNSCDDSNSNKSLNYNSYNLRAPRTGVTKVSTDSTVSDTTMNTVIVEATTPDFLSDNSNLECDNSSDVNLKDMFKTIDPTASPFC